jgi:hypothetical protein
LGANGRDQLSGGIRELPQHNTSVPSGIFALHEATGKGVSVQESGVGIRSSSGLAKDEFFEGNAGELVDLEDGGVREVGLGGGEEGCAVIVILTLVVELNVVPVDGVAYGLRNGVVGSLRVESGTVGEPGTERGMGDDEFCRK